MGKHLPGKYRHIVFTTAGQLPGRQTNLQNKTNGNLPNRFHKGKDARGILKRIIFNGDQVKIKMKIDLYNAAIRRII